MPVRSVLLLVPLGLMCASQIFFLLNPIMRMARSPRQDQTYVIRDVTIPSHMRWDDVGLNPPVVSENPVPLKWKMGHNVVSGNNLGSQNLLSKNSNEQLPTNGKYPTTSVLKSVLINSRSSIGRGFWERDVERFIVRDNDHVRETVPYHGDPADGIIVGVMKITNGRVDNVQSDGAVQQRNNTASLSSFEGGLAVQSSHQNSTASAMTSPGKSLEERCRLRLPSGAACREGKVTRRVHENSAEGCNFVELLQNCSAFRRAHGYEDKPVTAEEKAFPLAFAIKMHTSPEQAEQLLRAIYRPHNVYCVHVDKKAPPGVFATMQEVGRCLGNVVVLEERVDVIYASARLLQAELLCMRTLLELPVPWAYYLNLAGQEFPLKTNLETVKALKIMNGVNDIETFDFPRNQQEHYKYRYVEKDGELVKTNQTKPAFPFQLALSKGSAYGAFSRPFVRFLLEDDVARAFLGWLEDVYAPEEMAWATLNTLPWAPGGYTQGVRHVFKTHASRAVVWAWDKATCRGRFIRSVCIFGARDLAWLLRQPQLVANKFHASWDAGALDCLESLLQGRTRHPDPSAVDWSFFRRLPHVEYYRTLRDEEKTWQYLTRMKEDWLKTHSMGSAAAAPAS